MFSDLSPDREPLSWDTRIKIAVGAARGLEYLHCKANPPVIYRDLKSANILLDDQFNPKLSDFGLAKLAPVGDKTHVSTRVMGTYGYCAPEYAMSGKLTLKSDIYSFGVVMLELITGKKAIDSSKRPGEQNLVSWVSIFLFPFLSCFLDSQILNFIYLCGISKISYWKQFFYDYFLISFSNAFVFINAVSSIFEGPEEVCSIS